MSSNPKTKKDQQAEPTVTNILYHVWVLRHAVRIVNSFYYNLTHRDYNHLLHYRTFTQLTISTLLSLHPISCSFHVWDVDI
jgi:hypothetical protein